MKTFIRVMKALTDPNRVKILKMLESRELCVGEITAVLGLAQSTVSKHLKILEDAGFIDSCKDGAWVNYRLTEGVENDYAHALQIHLKTWLNESPLVVDIVNQADTVNRQRLCAA